MVSLAPHLEHVKSRFLSQMADGRLERPVEEGSGLPNLCYTDADFFALEQQTVFRDNWVFTAFAHDLARTGDLNR